jgi:hypothetical protein
MTSRINSIQLCNFLNIEVSLDFLNAQTPIKMAHDLFEICKCAVSLVSENWV